MKYVMVSTAVTDLTYPYGHTDPTAALGGAGTYALAGAKVWTDDVTLVTGVGADFAGAHGHWFETNEISMNHILVKDVHTPTTLIHYFKDGERKETSAFGSEHYRLMEAGTDDIQAALGPDVKGVYIFKEAILEYWQAVSSMKQAYGCTVLWEINADSAAYSQMDHVRKIAEMIDIFSINMTEARSLLNLHTVDEIVEQFRSWKTPLVFLRDGGRGAYMIARDEYVHVPPVQDVNVVDATGGGNSSSAGVLYGICEGYSLYDAGVIGSISASICLEQQGVPEFLDADLRKRANRLLENMRRK
ncbi:carbohydrate kinase family protein [Paenibacillus eucommiae]|uniref:Sugar/nucleoside kinase (Ribokinase family) n=1 Tax=Paenibacillus eucommiae TaxID=1355755 RepID=A0ABS4J9V0_9BACL|nr:PfkB family carbohydrate kinase [Paenibacillus eucommiae]MBP1996639.1 sugar/nucleoside kinase (ribokinase family) [Paenibacillus eucommiae]